MAKSGSAKGANPKQSQHGAKPAGTAAPGETLDEFDIADEMKGDNDLQGRDQARAPSERHAQAGATGDTDDLIESFRKNDKKHRAASEAEKRRGGVP